MNNSVPREGIPAAQIEALGRRAVDARLASGSESDVCIWYMQSEACPQVESMLGKLRPLQNLPKFVLIEPQVKKSNIEWFMGNIQSLKPCNPCNPCQEKKGYSVNPINPV